MGVLIDLGYEPAPEDYPPGLGWERCIWDMFWSSRRQWLLGPMGEKRAINHAVFIPRMQAKGWDIEQALKLLTTVEDALLTTDEPSSNNE